MLLYTRSKRYSEYFNMRCFTLDYLNKRCFTEYVYEQHLDYFNTCYTFIREKRCEQFQECTKFTRDLYQFKLFFRHMLTNAKYKKNYFLAFAEYGFFTRYWNWISVIYKSRELDQTESLPDNKKF